MKTRRFLSSKIGFLTLVLSITTNFLIADSQSSGDTGKNDKLLIIMLDGFRWDYYNMYNSSLPAFSKFLSEGVQAEHVEPIFPSQSFPSWTTISTGVYAETHGILGNYMFDKAETNPAKAVFSLNDYHAMRLTKWWQNSEPLWVTATKNGKNAFLRWWSRCEIAFHGVKPKECTGYTWVPNPGVDGIEATFKVAVEKLKGDFDLVMVYSELIDVLGHRKGPNSSEIKEALVGTDTALQTLMDDLSRAELKDKVNIIFVSDHGMTWVGNGSEVEYVFLDDYISADDVVKVVESGPYLCIATLPENREAVYDKLKNMPGVDVYKREDIPEELHVKQSPLINDILLVAKKKYYIRGLNGSPKQLPPSNFSRSSFAGGSHGYRHATTTDMQAIFFAKGPAFKKGIIHPPIHLVDEYQIFAHLLKIPAQPNNGTWSRVSGMLLNTRRISGRSASAESPGSGSERWLPTAVNIPIFLSFILCFIII